MAIAPVTRVTPVGDRLKKGYRSTIAFELDPDVSIWEIEVTPPGLDGGEMIDTTTMFNTTFETMEPNTLMKVTDGGMRVAFDPVCYDQLFALINQKGIITTKFSNGDSISDYGILRTFQPDGMVRNGMPTANCVISYTNTHPTTGAEVAPDYITSAGTT